MPDRAALEALLRAYAPQDSQERAHRDRMRALLEATENPLERGHFSPGHFTASAFVLSPDRAQVLLIHHAKLDRWLQPGGHIEAHDADVLGAARRELLEETGISAPALEIEGIFDLDAHAIPALGADPVHEHFDVRFLFRAASRQLPASREATAARWVPLDEVDAITPDRSVMRAVRKLQRHVQELRASLGAGG